MASLAILERRANMTQNKIIEIEDSMYEVDNYEFLRLQKMKVKYEEKLLGIYKEIDKKSGAGSDALTNLLLD